MISEEEGGESDSWLNQKHQKSSDGQDFEIEETVAQISLSIKQTIKQDCSKTIIPILRNKMQAQDTLDMYTPWILKGFILCMFLGLGDVLGVLFRDNVGRTFVIASSTVAWELLQEGDDKSTTEELEIKTEQETISIIGNDVTVFQVFTIIIGTKTSGFMAKQNPVFQHRDSNAATISSCVISSSISFADPPQKDAAVQSEVLKLQAMIRGKPMQQDVSNELKNTQQLNSYIVDKVPRLVKEVCLVRVVDSGVKTL
ncbi:SKP1-like protein 1B [Tanacetum coccineum]